MITQGLNEHVHDPVYSTSNRMYHFRVVFRVIRQWNNLCKSVCMFEQLCKPTAAADDCSEGFDLSTLPMTQHLPASLPQKHLVLSVL